VHAYSYNRHQKNIEAGKIMGLDLDTKCLDRLAEATNDALKTFTIQNRIFLTNPAYKAAAELDNIIPKGKTHGRLAEYISDEPFSDFILGTLHRELQETQDFDLSDVELPIEKIEGFEDVNALAKRLVTEFDSLPWSYAITFPLPDSLSTVFCKSHEEWDISDSMKIMTGKALDGTFPLKSGIEKRDKEISGKNKLLTIYGGESPKWGDDQAYLQVKVEGFVGKYATSETLQRAIDTLRAFFGIAIGQRLLEHERRYGTQPGRAKYYIHRHSDDAWVVEEVRELEARYSDVINQLTFDDLGGHVKTNEQKASRLESELRSMTKVFRTPSRAKNLLLGAQWMLDSFSGSDELLQFVQAAVVVEILLGDKASSDQTGLGELLANRCAYLVAKSHSQRLEILANFREIYDVRSKIVHRGKNRLAAKERDLFAKLRWFCLRIIQEEATLIEQG
jgi:hypothetical protein